MPRQTLRRRDPGDAALLDKIEQGQPWERPERDLDVEMRLYELWTGYDHLGLGYPDEAARRAGWEVLGEALTRGQAERFPGTRPWGWWRYEAPEPRRMIEGSPERISPAAKTWRGMPSAHACRYESEMQYLRRLRLLSGFENRGISSPLDPPDPGTRYALDVVAGKLPACKAIVWACQRHLDDLEDAWRRGLFYDWRAAEYRLEFARWIRHFQGPKGPRAGKPGEIFEPEPWQCFRTGAMWGWMTFENWRRFSDAFTFIPRKTGKTFESAVDSLFALIADGEAAPEVFAVATKRDQAAKCVMDAIGIREASPLIASATRSSRRLIKGPKWVACDATAGMFETKTSDAAKELGGNISFGVIDEAAAHPDDSNARQVRDSMGGRAQRDVGHIGAGGGPMMSEITTAGADREAYGGQRYDLARRILDPEDETELDSMFAFIAELDDREAWASPVAWDAAIPNLGVAKSRSDLEKMVAGAQQDAAKLPDLLIYHFDVWAEHAETWLDWPSWLLCQDPDVNATAWRGEQMERLRGERCYAGLDFGDTFDMNALILFFPDVEPRPVVLPFYWIPRENAETRSRRDHVGYLRWADRGFLTLTPGKETDTAWIVADIVGAEGRDAESLADRFDIVELRYDPWRAKEPVKDLVAAGLTCEVCRQAMPSLAEPAAKLESMVLGAAFDHGANPVLSWNARNATAKRDPSGNVMPDKSKAKRKRIDGISAFVAMLSGWIAAEKDASIDAGWLLEEAANA